MSKLHTAKRPHPVFRVVSRNEPTEAQPQSDVQPEPLEKKLSAAAARVAIRRLLPKGCVLVLGDNQEMLNEAQRVAIRHSATIYVAKPDEDVPMEWIRMLGPWIDMVLVDGDCMGDVGDTVDFCLRVRNAAPSLPIIMVSSEISRDDFTCERMMACDVSLKNGFSSSKLEKTIPIAYANNSYYQSRML